jgi:hypothetical protein
LKIVNETIGPLQASHAVEPEGEDPRIRWIAAVVGRKLARDYIKRMQGAKDDIAADGHHPDKPDDLGL